MKKMIFIAILAGMTMLGNINAGQDRFQWKKDTTIDSVVGVRDWVGCRYEVSDGGIHLYFSFFDPSQPIAIWRGHYVDKAPGNTYLAGQAGYVFDGMVYLQPGVDYFFDKQAHPNETYAYMIWQFPGCETFLQVPKK